MSSKLYYFYEKIRRMDFQNHCKSVDFRDNSLMTRQLYFPISSPRNNPQVYDFGWACTGLGAVANLATYERGRDCPKIQVGISLIVRMVNML